MKVLIGALAALTLFLFAGHPLAQASTQASASTQSTPAPGFIDWP
ncbi:hypothetical protein ACFWWC_38130 [Streptomyces sp. NPDC058642]